MGAHSSARRLPVQGLGTTAPLLHTWRSPTVPQLWSQTVRQFVQVPLELALFRLTWHTGVTPAQAAVTTDAVLTAYHAVKTTGNVKPTETILIFGLGGLGFNALQIVLAIGARVIVTDKREEVLAEAIKFGVPKEDVIPIGTNVVEFVQERGLVVDIVIDFVGVNETFTASQELGKQIQHWLHLLWYRIADQVYSQTRWQTCTSWSSRSRTYNQQPPLHPEEVEY